MTLDSGWALMISTVIGVVLVWIGNLVARHFDNSHGVATGADERVDDLEKKFLEYKAYVAEHYVKTDSVDRIKRDIFNVIQRLEEKMDRLISGGGKHD